MKAAWVYLCVCVCERELFTVWMSTTSPQHTLAIINLIGCLTDVVVTRACPGC